MIKKILFLFTLFTPFWVFAEVKVAGTTLNPSSWSYIVGNRNVTIIYEDDEIYDTIADVPDYFLITLCSDTSKILSWYTETLPSSGGSPASDVVIYKTNVPCSYPNSDYTGGRVVYITGANGKIGSVSGTNGYFYNRIVYYQPSDTSMALLGAYVSDVPVTIDYANNTIISQNQELIDKNNTIINQNQTLIDQNSQIINGQNGLWDKVNNFHGAVIDSNTSDPSDKFSQFNSYLPENGVITQLISLPITLFQRILTSVNGTCNTFNLGTLLGTNLTLPCINISNYIGSTLYGVIDILFCGFFILHISKTMKKAFDSFSSLKEGDVLSD